MAEISPTTRRHRAWDELRAAAPALLGYLAVRLVGLLALWIGHDGSLSRTLAALTDLYDSVWLLEIAENGYDAGGEGKSNLAFFPLYPMAVRGLVLLLPGEPFVAAGLLVSWLSALACAWGLFAIGRLLHDPRTGTLLAIIWGVLPHAIVESMAYTESLFTALSVWSLYALLTRRWILAGALCMIAGLNRPTSLALIGVVGLAALIEVIASRGRSWRAWLGGALSPLGWLAYILWVGFHTGAGPGRWFQIQAEGWKLAYDGGVYTWRSVRKILTGESSTLQMYTVVLVLTCSLVLLAISILQRQRWPLLVFSIVLLLITLGGEGFMNAKARFLVPAFPLLLPLAVGLAAVDRKIRWVVLIALTLISAYYGVYLLMKAPISP